MKVRKPRPHWKPRNVTLTKIARLTKGKMDFPYVIDTAAREGRLARPAIEVAMEARARIEAAELREAA